MKKLFAKNREPRTRENTTFQKISEFRGSRVFPPRVNLRYKKRVGKTINLRHTIVPPTNITPPKNQHFQILTGSHSLGCRILHVR